MMQGVYFVPRGLPFLASLAQGLLAEAEENPLALANMRVLLPNRRSVRSLREIFLSITDGKAVLLPRMIALGDVDDDSDAQIASLLAGEVIEIPPPVSSVERLLQLSRMVQKKDDSITAAQALALARDLARLLDELQLYNVDVSRLAKLPHERYAEHWQQTVQFLDIVTRLWPEYLRAVGHSDPAAYRLAWLRRLAAAWQEHPPSYPVIMAGIARAEPAVMELAREVAQHGAVVLPAFDTSLPADAWLHLDTVHPDALLREVIEALGVPRDKVQAWGATVISPRAEWLSMALQPAVLTANWRAQVEKNLSVAAIGGIDYVPCADEAAEAQTVALLVRGALEIPQQTVAVVTPDRALARRVAALLKRWGIEADDSSGRPLLLAPLGVYLQLVAAAALPTATMHDALALLKHPLCGLGLSGVDKARAVTVLEINHLRGHYPAAGALNFCTYVEQAAGADDTLQQLAAALRAGVGPLATLLQQGVAPARDMLHAHLLAAEMLAATHDESGEARLWIGAEAEAASAPLQELGAALSADYSMQADDYAPWLAQMLSGCAVRVPYGLHPRVTIHGLIEARLQQADVMILAGLNEGVWPSLPAASPWLNRDMRRALGLPDSEEHITQQAHDFISAAMAHRVYLTRALRAGGVPTVPARWLMRLQATLVPLGLDKQWQQRGLAIAEWSGLVDAPAAEAPLARAPAPQPPVALRPRSAYVTDIERLMRDPYGFYARQILRLRALDALADTPSAAERGRYMHEVLAKFLQHVGDRALLPDDFEMMQEIAAECLQPYALVAGIKELWGTWMQEVAAWFWQQEKDQRSLRVPVVLEGKGARVFDDIGFTLKARADRIDKYRAGGVVIVDYKTGKEPSVKEIASGASPQLALEALIAAGGGFDNGAADITYTGEYWHLAGTFEKCKISTRVIDLPVTEAGLRALVQLYLLGDAPFTALPRAPRDYNDYKHLARTAEWAFADDEDEAE